MPTGPGPNDLSEPEDTDEFLLSQSTKLLEPEDDWEFGYDEDDESEKESEGEEPPGGCFCSDSQTFVTIFILTM